MIASTTAEVRTARLKLNRPLDTKIHIFVKIVMTVIFAWSCFFWAGVAVLHFRINDPEYTYLADKFMWGSIIMLVGLILCWLRFYIVQLPFFATGLIIYLQAAQEMINTAAETKVKFNPSFELRYLPTIVMMILSAALLMARIYKIIADRIDARNKFDNMPTESILEKHREE